MVVDDHTIFRRGLVSILESYPDIKVVGEASDGEEGVARTGDLLPDVVIMDLAMPRMNGIEATRIIKSRFMSVDVIALSFQESEHARSSVLQAGAKAYFTKSGPLDELVRAIRAHVSAPSGTGAQRSEGSGRSFIPPAQPKEARRAGNPLPPNEGAPRRASSRSRKA
jgi:two-component system NarL family response regulator